MIVLINGPFGVGKSTTAWEVAGMLPGAAVFDPERIGWVLRRLPRPLGTDGDYQDLARWRSLTVALAVGMRRITRRDLIVPMTIWRKAYFDEITSGWREGDSRVVCLRLVASEETLRARILARPEAQGGHAWCLDHLDAGLALINDPAFGIAVETDGRSPRDVAEEIVRLVSARSAGPP